MTAARAGKMIDSCHRYGWLIALLGNLVMFAYFIGGVKTIVESHDARLQRIERFIDDLRTDLKLRQQ